MTAIKQKNDQAQAIVVGYTQSEIDALPAIIGMREVARIACVSERTVTREACKGNLHDGFHIGYEFFSECDVTGVDFDHVVVDGTIADAELATIIDCCETYVEYSPSPRFSTWRTEKKFKVFAFGE